MNKSIHDKVWGLGVRVRNMAKHEGLLGPLESGLAWLGPRLIPPPSYETTVTLPLGIQMTIPPNFPSYRNFATGLYEEDLTRLFLGILREGMTVVDVGANIGYYTLLASRIVGSRGKVYSFEPEERNYSYLVKNSVRAGSTNVATVRKAVFDRTGTAELVSSRAGERGWVQREPAFQGSMKVETTTLDEFFEGESWPKIDVIKMDIEGSEEFALDGMRELCRRNAQLRLIVELNLSAMRRIGASNSVMKERLLQLGFEGGYLIERSLRPFSLSQGLPRTEAIYNILFVKS